MFLLELTALNATAHQRFMNRIVGLCSSGPAPIKARPSDTLQVSTCCEAVLNPGLGRGRGMLGHASICLISHEIHPACGTAATTVKPDRVRRNRKCMTDDAVSTEPVCADFPAYWENAGKWPKLRGYADQYRDIRAGCSKQRPSTGCRHREPASSKLGGA